MTEKSLCPVAHRDVLATPCPQMPYSNLYNITAARRGVFTSLPFSKSPAKFIILFAPPPLPAGLKASSCSSYSEREFSASP